MWTWVVELTNEVLDFLYRLQLTLVSLISDLFLTILTQILIGVRFIIDSVVSLFSVVDISEYFDWLPVDAVNVMSLVGLPQMMTMIVSALGIRLILQLIPFVRLGS